MLRHRARPHVPWNHPPQGERRSGRTDGHGHRHERDEAGHRQPHIHQRAYPLLRNRQRDLLERSTERAELHDTGGNEGAQRQSIRTASAAGSLQRGKFIRKHIPARSGSRIRSDIQVSGPQRHARQRLHRQGQSCKEPRDRQRRAADPHPRRT